MASRAPTARWEAPQFSFNSPQQTQEWKNFYIRVLDYLETLDIDPEAQDDTKHGWKQIKMMFQGEDSQALQSLIDIKPSLLSIRRPLHMHLKPSNHALKKKSIFGTSEMK